ncbi:MAG: hypothetical protein KF774_08750 [Planctomyces sp.]|nr:hypothetical protein [Planctomyces sp.]
MTNVKVRKLVEAPDEEGARRLAVEMQAAGERSLEIEVEASKRKSVEFLESFSFLEELTVGGHAKGLDAIANLASLRELCFLRVTVPDFGFLQGLKQLRIFDMRFGGCKAFETLSVAKSLFGLRLMRLPSLQNLDFVSAMPKLQLLDVDSCKGIERLPDFSKNKQLRRLLLQTMNGLISLEGIESARALEDLIVMEAKLLPPGEFARVRQCKSLRGVLAGVGLTTSARYREALACIPENLQMDGFYATENANFAYQGYQPFHS